MPTPDDPLRDFRFRLEIAGILAAAFSGARLPTAEDHGTGTLSLQRGITDSMELYDWFALVSEHGANATGARRNVSLVLLDASGGDKARWNVINAWPSKFATSGLSRADGEMLIETLELECDYLTRVR